MDAPSPPLAATAPPPRVERGWRRSLRFGPIVVVAVFTGFLSLRSQPSLADVAFVPRPVVRFLDGHDFLKNVAGFGALAAAFHFACVRPGEEARRRAVGRLGMIAGCVVALELAQLWLPARSCDWRDVLAGWLGAAAATMPWLARPRPPQ